MKKSIFLLLIAVLFLLTGCAAGGQVMDGDGMVNSYTQIDQETARKMMAKDDGHVIVDVRRQDEYDEGHIPGAVCIPNETIESEQPEELPDLDQIILIYCRSGNRSKQAAQKLSDMGYTNIYEFGGIIDWTGEVVTETDTSEDSAKTELWSAAEMPVRIRYDRMWEYSDYAEISDSERIAEIVDAVKSLKVGEPTDMAVDDFTDILTFYFADGDSIRLEFEEQNLVTEDQTRYQVEGLSELRSILDEIMSDQLEEAIQPVPTLVIEANGHVFYAGPEDNTSAEALIERLSSGEIELNLQDYGNFEKVGPLPWELPTNDEQITTEPGDIILYQGNQITIYYDENTWNFTRLAKINNITKEELLDVLGSGDVTVKLWVEWSE